MYNSPMPRFCGAIQRNGIMGTRAVITIEGVGYACIYKHWDGNPDNLMPWLERFNQEFKANRGDDPSYKFAQLLRDSVRSAGGDVALDDSLYTGWGVMPFGYSDYQYLYTLHADGSVTYTE